MPSKLAITALAAMPFISCTSGTNPSIPETSSEKQMLGLMEKFDRWDHDGNGQLSAGEIDAGVATLKGTSREVTFDGADVIEHYDRNGDRTVSLREAQTGYKRTIEDGAAPLQR
jgi:hypothetical protein